MKDFRGREIKVGSLIAYPGRVGSSCWITVARVLSFGTREGWSYTGKKTEPTITVQIVKSSDSYQKPRKSTIYALNRVLVVEEPDGQDKSKGVQAA